MTQRFYPRLERLEARRLLVGDVMDPMTRLAEDAATEEAMVEEVTTEAVTTEAVAMEMPVDPAPMVVSVEQQDGSLLIAVGVTEPGHPPHYVSVIGGMGAWTDANGYVRFQIPLSTQWLEMEITNDQGVNYATARFEFDEAGALLRQIWQTHDELMGEGESDKLASMIGSLVEHDPHSSMARDMSAMAMDDHQVVHVPGVDGATVVSHSSTHAFDFAVTRGRMTDHSQTMPNDAASRTSSSGDSTGRSNEDSGSTDSADHGGMAGAAETGTGENESHESDSANVEHELEAATYSGGEFAAVSPSLLESLIAEDVAAAPNWTNTTESSPEPLTRTPATQPSAVADDSTENAVAEPIAESAQVTSQNGRTWYVLKIAVTSLVSAAAAVFFERRAHSIARERQRTAQNPRVE